MLSCVTKGEGTLEGKHAVRRARINGRGGIGRGGASGGADGGRGTSHRSWWWGRGVGASGVGGEHPVQWRPHVSVFLLLGRCSKAAWGPVG